MNAPSQPKTILCRAVQLSAIKMDSTMLISWCRRQRPKEHCADLQQHNQLGQCSALAPWHPSPAPMPSTGVRKNPRGLT